MKKIKEFLSIYSSLDKVIAIFSIVMLIIVMSCCTGCCKAQTINSTDSHYFDASGENFDIDKDIPIYADGVVDFFYDSQNEEYIIEYRDDDIFDYENIQNSLTYVSDEEEVDYITIFCSKKLFFDYLSWYAGIDKNSELFYAASDKYVIEEEWIENEDESYLYFRLKEK